MITLNKIVFTLILLLPNIYAQSGDFNVEQYKIFLQNHQNMESSQLLEMHDAGNFRDNINLNFNDALYFDTIATKFSLTNFEKSLIQRNGFMVSERLSRNSFGEPFLEIFDDDLPVFISTDAILHAFHMSYDRILKDVELGILIDRVTTILNQLNSSMLQLHNAYSSNPEMMQMLKDVDVYVTVPRKLFNQNASPYYSDNNAVVNDIITQIMNEQGFQSYTLFSENCRIMDWSQFKPRGHYAGDELLEKYFRMMMWLGRMEIYLLAPSASSRECLPQTFEDIQRQTIDAFLINELFDLAGSKSLYDELEDIIQFFVGKSDNVTLPNIQYLKDAIGINNSSELLDSLQLIEFQDTLKNQSFAYQLILSQILFSNPMSPDSIVPASAFMLFGQRFVIDSYVTGQVVFDRILYNGSRICRLFPSTLDVLFTLGNDASAQLLIPELNQYHYSSNLAALRYLIDSYGLEFWNSSLYNTWLRSIKTINPPVEREELPAFMQTAAFWQQKMNTQLSSWTQLRHDNLLYAKQSYTGGTDCTYPYSYVEPFPELYLNLKTIAEIAYERFQNITFSDPFINEEILNYFSLLGDVSDTLATIAQKELDGIELTNNESEFLKKLIYSSGRSGAEFNGWYAKLFYKDKFGEDGLLKKDHIVADIHTVPTDCGGSPIGAIPHVGTGPINLGVVVTENHQGNLTAFIGPVLSYYEFTTTNFLRLTDDEWDETHLYLSVRPSWNNIYLADSSGNTKGDGPILITSVLEDPNGSVLPVSHLIAKHYPNPFNPSVIINFSIPAELTNSLTELVIYDIQGQQVNTLVKEVLPSGNYLTKWNATSDEGDIVSSGVYLYVLRVANQQVTGKMVFQK
jgi:hypothetical protein